MINSVAILALVFLIAITAFNIRADHDSRSVNNAHPSIPKQQSHKKQSKVVSRCRLIRFNVTLRLPNEKIVTERHPGKWNDLFIQFTAADIPKGSSNSDVHAYTISNHSSIVSDETIATSAGKADLSLSKREQPAAAHSSAAAYEFWVIIYGQEHAYAIEAVFSGRQSAAKNSLLNLLQNWHVPKDGLK
ncbi:hypothetical protein NIE88_06325 [Sporolactobacillus shoreicorticis]|uniref:Uncharacterized protein n=1 Tax=Sporolactobacillus shoreicorticis TaxID=1923877 RepID=A0ABW5S2E7_9BACL|nr:hypothetical protein [Sporolactobacillus shoreicorticis]MCO7125382.1 hypothetical protein [Sporolactobacillus shoreicorticis]